MRVITGSARGSRLRAVPGELTRPTAGHVKEAIFSIIQFEIEGRRVLDLFAGTGQMGIEALSRGAREAVFVDHSPAAVAVIRDNLRHTKLEAGAQVVQGDAAAFLGARPPKFDVIFVDPPYQSSLAVLEKIAVFDLLSEGGVIVCETGENAALPALPPPYAQGRHYRYGTKAVTLYHREVLP